MALLSAAKRGPTLSLRPAIKTHLCALKSVKRIRRCQNFYVRDMACGAKTLYI